MSDNRPLFILAGNGSNYNRGCEAILRGTVRILRNYFDNPEFLVFTAYSNEDQFKQQCLEERDESIIHKKMYKPYKRYDFLWFLFRTLERTIPGTVKHIMYKDLKPRLNEVEAVLALGGDNYSLHSGRKPKVCTDLDDLVVSRGKPLVIWGASIGPFSIYPDYEKYIMNHFRKVYIMARETATIEYLAEHGVTDNVYRVADPAFVMEPEEPKKETVEFEIEDGAIGLNLSPLMSHFVTNRDIPQWASISADIVRKILRKTGRRVYLIPHVFSSPGTDDYAFLKKVLSIIPEESHRITLIPPKFNSPEIKWIISKMRVFAGARTHSTIAAFSTCVPTLSFSYSIKAKGLSKDMYGHSNYCLAPEELTADTVFERIKKLLKEADNIRSHLELCVPHFKSLAMNSGKILKEILQQTSS